MELPDASPILNFEVIIAWRSHRTLAADEKESWTRDMIVSNATSAAKADWRSKKGTRI